MPIYFNGEKVNATNTPLIGGKFDVQSVVKEDGTQKLKITELPFGGELPFNDRYYGEIELPKEFANYNQYCIDSNSNNFVTPKLFSSNDGLVFLSPSRYSSGYGLNKIWLLNKESNLWEVVYTSTDSSIAGCTDYTHCCENGDVYFFKPFVMKFNRATNGFDRIKLIDGNYVGFSAFSNEFKFLDIDGIVYSFSSRRPFKIINDVAYYLSDGSVDVKANQYDFTGDGGIFMGSPSYSGLYYYKEGVTNYVVKIEGVTSTYMCEDERGFNGNMARLTDTEYLLCNGVSSNKGIWHIDLTNYTASLLEGSIKGNNYLVQNPITGTILYRAGASGSGTWTWYIIDRETLQLENIGMSASALNGQKWYCSSTGDLFYFGTTASNISIRVFDEIEKKFIQVGAFGLVNDVYEDDDSVFFSGNNCSYGTYYGILRWDKATRTMSYASTERITGGKFYKEQDTLKVFSSYTLTELVYNPNTYMFEKVDNFIKSNFGRYYFQSYYSHYSSTYGKLPIIIYKNQSKILDKMYGTLNENGVTYNTNYLCIAPTSATSNLSYYNIPTHVLYTK